MFMQGIGGYYDDLGVFLYLTPIVFCFFAAYSLLINRHRTTPHIYLALLFVVLGIGMTFSFVYDRYLTANHNEILRSVNLIFTTCSSMTVLFYFTSLMRPKILTRKFLISILLGWLAYSIFIILLESSFDATPKVTGWKDVIEHISTPLVLFRLLTSLIVIVIDLYLLIFVLRMYRDHKKQIKENYSYEEGVDLSWLRKMIVLVLTLAASDIVWMIDSTDEAKIFFNVTCLITIIFMYQIGFRQQDIVFLDADEKEEEQAETQKEADAELQSKTKPVQPNIRLKKTKEKLIEYFREEKPYLDPDLTLGKLANDLAIKDGYLSRMLRSEFNTNFFGYVNKHRAEYAVKLIDESEKVIVVEHICAASGFKSKSAFYKYFKEITGLTPQEYAASKK